MYLSYALENTRVSNSLLFLSPRSSQEFLSQLRISQFYNTKYLLRRFAKNNVNHTQAHEVFMCYIPEVCEQHCGLPNNISLIVFLLGCITLGTLNDLSACKQQALLC